jgi:hypothetical protein
LRGIMAYARNTTNTTCHTPSASTRRVSTRNPPPPAVGSSGPGNKHTRSGPFLNHKNSSHVGTVLFYVLLRALETPTQCKRMSFLNKIKSPDSLVCFLRAVTAISAKLLPSAPYCTHLKLLKPKIRFHFTDCISIMRYCIFIFVMIRKGPIRTCISFIKTLFPTHIMFLP